MFNFSLKYIRISLKDFRGAVLQSATKIVENLSGSHQSSRPEVNKPNVETFVNDDVLIFYVTVKNVLSPEIEDCCYKLGEGKQKDVSILR